MGGMAGEASRQIIRRVLGFEGPETPTEAALDIATEGALQGGIEAGTAGLGRLAAPLRRGAAAQYTRALRPTTLENKAIAEGVTPKLLERGVRGTTEAIEKRASTEVGKLRPQLESAYRNLPGGPTAAKSPVSTALTDLERLKGKYMVDGKVVNAKAVDAIESVQQIIEQHGNNVSPQSIRKLKQIFDEAVSEAGGFTTSDLTTNYSLKAQKEAANTFRRILHDAHPNVAALDREMSFWLDVQQVARATNQRQLGQQGGLTKTIALPLIGGAATALGLTGQGEASAGTALTAIAILAARDARFRTWSALRKTQLANALARQDVRMATALLTRLGITTAQISKAIEERATGDQEANRIQEQ